MTWYVVIEGGHHYGYPTLRGAAGDVCRTARRMGGIAAARCRVRARENGEYELRDLTADERKRLEEEIRTVGAAAAGTQATNA